MKKLLLALLLVAIGVGGRTVFHLAPNVEFVTLASLLAASYLGRKYALLVPFAIMVVTDTIIGNTNIFIFTWSAWLMIGLSGLILKGLEGMKRVGVATGLGIFASLFFFLYTNFGVWALDAWGMYSRDLSGLIHCYLMGLPFLRLNLVSNLIFVPVGFSVTEIIFRKEKVFKFGAVRVVRKSNK